MEAARNRIDIPSRKIKNPTNGKHHDVVDSGDIVSKIMSNTGSELFAMIGLPVAFALKNKSSHETLVVDEKQLIQDYISQKLGNNSGYLFQEIYPDRPLPEKLARDFFNDPKLILNVKEYASRHPTFWIFEPYDLIDDLIEFEHAEIYRVNPGFFIQTNYRRTKILNERSWNSFFK